MIPESERALAPITVPVARTGFYKDPFASGGPSSLIDATNYTNIIQMNDFFSKGGHFSAMEQPELWCQDVNMFFRNCEVVEVLLGLREKNK